MTCYNRFDLRVCPFRGGGSVSLLTTEASDGDPAQSADSYFVADQVQGTRTARHEAIPGGVHAVLARPLTEAREVFVARMPTLRETETLALLPGTPVCGAVAHDLRGRTRGRGDQLPVLCRVAQARIRRPDVSTDMRMSSWVVS
ncbi:hypothetical protein GCM10009556_082590 [Acrocarpospora pleiomorpha]